MVNKNSGQHKAVGCLQDFSVAYCEKIAKNIALEYSYKAVINEC